MRLSVSEITAAVAGSCDSAGDTMVTGVTWDSREVKPGDLYVALPGERVDGHDFADAAAAAGAVAALVSRPVGADIAAIVVPDTSAALTELAAYWRTKLTGLVIGLTGSSGKTSTKNLVRDVLSHGASVVATAANQNNELGVPRTLLAADADTSAVVVEMGMRGMGQIEDLCKTAAPDWGLITNVGESHIELLGSRDNIAKAKAELFEALPDGSGVAFVNAADDYADEVCRIGRLRERGVVPVFYDGYGAVGAAASDGPVGPDDAFVWATGISFDSEGRPSFTLNARNFDRVGKPGADGLQRLELRLRALAQGRQQRPGAQAVFHGVVGQAVRFIGPDGRVAAAHQRQGVLRLGGGFRNHYRLLRRILQAEQKLHKRRVRNFPVQNEIRPVRRRQP